jgi:hypothetical protein
MDAFFGAKRLKCSVDTPSSFPVKQINKLWGTQEEVKKYGNIPEPKADCVSSYEIRIKLIAMCFFKAIN